MGTVSHLRTVGQGIALGDAVSRYLATLDHAERRKTHHVYGQWFGALTRTLGPDTAVADLTADVLSAAFRQCWGEAKPATWNSRRGAVRSLLAYCETQGWIPDAGALMTGIESRKLAPDRTRALSKADIERLLTSDKHSLRDRTLWSLLYDTAARSAEVLRLNVDDLDRANHKAKVHRKGGAQDLVYWDTRTARLLTALLKGRKSGPVFVTERKGKGWSAGHIDTDDLAPDGHARLSYRQAEDDFKKASGGATLHQLRHSALTHMADDGFGTHDLMVVSGHTSVRSLVKYARPSAEAVQRRRVAISRARER